MMNLMLSAVLSLGSGAQVGDPATARITVRLPPGAVLYVDDVPSPSRAETQTFDTTLLQPGARYFHVLQAVLPGQARSAAASRRISFQAGDRMDVDLRGSSGTEASKNAPATNRETKDTRPKFAAPRPGSSGDLDNAEGLRPSGPPPQQVLARMDSDGRLVLRQTVTEFVPETRQRTVKDKNGELRTEEYTVVKPVSVEKEWVHDPKEVKAFRADGTKVDLAGLRALGSKETPALISRDGQTVDAFYLQVVDPGTLILVLPPPKFEGPKTAAA